MTLLELRDEVERLLLYNPGNTPVCLPMFDDFAGDYLADVGIVCELDTPSGTKVIIKEY